MLPIYSFIIPVYNRPDELSELLESLSHQTVKDFEVVVVEDGSTLSSQNVVNQYADRLTIRYYDEGKQGPSMARNSGMRKAKGAWFIFVDSDCILPEDYLQRVSEGIALHHPDVFGGPDQASPAFNHVQRAISYAMTSFLTTGGIRGGKRQVDRFYPRSFNMGVSREVFTETGGFPATKMHPGEDMVFSIEILRRGKKSLLISEAKVFHKRRTSFRQFFRQVYRFGRTRYVISTVYPETFKPFYLAPAFFTGGSLAAIVLAACLSILWLIPPSLYTLLILSDAFIQNRSVRVALMSVWASWIQLSAYGSGFMLAFFEQGILRRDPYGIKDKGFYA